MNYDFLTDPRFSGLTPFPTKVWLSSPTMHWGEQYWVDEAIRTNWVSTIGENIDEIESQIAEYIDVKHAVALSAGTAALHLATKLAGEKLYGQARPNAGTLQGYRVFCSSSTRNMIPGTCIRKPLKKPSKSIRMSDSSLSPTSTELPARWKN